MYLVWLGNNEVEYDILTSKFPSKYEIKWQSKVIFKNAEIWGSSEVELQIGAVESQSNSQNKKISL